MAEQRDPLARFFSSAANLWRADPWSSLPEGTALCIDAPELDMEGAALCVVSSEDGPPALWWTETVEDCMAFVEAFVAGTPESADLQEPVRMLSYDKGADLPEDARREITRQGLEVADAAAYPMLVVLGEDGEPRAAELDDILLTTVCIEALADMVKSNRKKLGLDEYVEHTVTVQLVGQAVPVTVTSPHPGLLEEHHCHDCGCDHDDEPCYDAAVGPDPEEWLELDEMDHYHAVQDYHDNAKPHDTPENPRLHAIIHAVAETQIASGEPPEARQALERLLAEGLSRHEAIHAICMPVAEFVYEVSKGSEVDADTHRKALKALTAESFRALAAEGSGNPCDTHGGDDGNGKKKRKGGKKPGK
jgi:hypothetical protein